ncbi:MAG: hypothetical protein U0805_22875 [Pirellulales bacterium]
MQSLTEGQRRAFFDMNRGQWEARSQQRMNEFFAMSKTEQQKRLDDILNDMQKRQANGNRQNGQNARGGNGGNRGSMTEAQREERSKRRIENTSPQMRAQFAQFRKMLDQRAHERGIQVDPGRGFGPPRGV